MTALEISKFSLREKLQIMQMIWEDLRSHVDTSVIPDTHQDLLDTRRSRVESGASKLLDWDQIKHTIGRR